ncbi:MAG: hypothetical protein A2029_13090 [Chloroflexi bacterium RBG_19FT_COMBO_47_9]|nr:MAG: hypothetical protein A2029_13090 [Chloroflexi bacterium RBG_19FT_COMBO_47_9]
MNTIKPEKKNLITDLMAGLTFAEENIFLATKTIGESGNSALCAATDWLVESSTEQDATRRLNDIKEELDG